MNGLDDVEAAAGAERATAVAAAVVAAAVDVGVAGFAELELEKGEEGPPIAAVPLREISASVVDDEEDDDAADCDDDDDYDDDGDEVVADAFEQGLMGFVGAAYDV